MAGIDNAYTAGHEIPQPTSRIRTRRFDTRMPKCRAFCERIDSRKRELQTTLTLGTNAPGVIEQRLVEIGMLRAQCQAAHHGAGRRLNAWDR